MSIPLVNGYVLFPSPPNWRESVIVKRSWLSGIGSALTGNEGRRAFRSAPKISLSWLHTVASELRDASIGQPGTFEAAVMAALKSGQACTGYWGRACNLAADVTSTSAQLQASSWPWAGGQYILFVDPITKLFDAVLVDSVTGGTLTLHSSVSRTYKAGSLCWPIVFGKLITDPALLLSGAIADFKLTITNIALPVVNPCTGVTITLDDSLADRNAGTAASGSIAASGGTEPYTFAVVSGTAPTGTSINLDGTWTGTPTVPGTYNFTVRASDANDCSGDRAYTIVIGCQTISMGDLPDGAQCARYDHDISVTGATLPLQSIGITAGNSLLDMDLTDTRSLSSGTWGLRGCANCGTWTFTLTAIDKNGCVKSKAYTIIISEVTTPCTNVPTCGTPCGFQVTLSGMDGANYTAPDEGHVMHTRTFTPSVSGGCARLGIVSDSPCSYVSQNGTTAVKIGTFVQTTDGVVDVSQDLYAQVGIESDGTAHCSVFYLDESGYPGGIHILYEGSAPTGQLGGSVPFVIHNDVTDQDYTVTLSFSPTGCPPS